MAMYMTDHEMREMRLAQTQHFEDVCTIKRINRTADGKGGFVTGAHTTVATDVACTITPAQQMLMGGQADRGLEVEKWKVTFPWGTDVQDADLLEWTAESIELQVENAKHSKSRGTAVRCTAEIVKGGAH